MFATIRAFFRLVREYASGEFALVHIENDRIAAGIVSTLGATVDELKACRITQEEWRAVKAALAAVERGCHSPEEWARVSSLRTDVTALQTDVNAVGHTSLRAAGAIAALTVRVAELETFCKGAEAWRAVVSMLAKRAEILPTPEEWARVKALAENAYDFTVGALPQSGITATKVGGAVAVTGMPGDPDPRDYYEGMVWQTKRR